MALRTDAASRRSPVAKSRPRSARCATGLVVRTSARTEKPAARRRRATAEPTNPLDPVSSTVPSLAIGILPVTGVKSRRQAGLHVGFYRGGSRLFQTAVTFGNALGQRRL